MSERRGRILLADDEAQLRSVATRILNRSGYDVVAVSNGRDALDALAAGQPFDLLVTDAVMPVVGGAELARMVASQHRGLPVLLMSGYADLGEATPGAAGQLPEGVTAFLEKPYRVDQLLAAVERTMSGTS